MERVHRQLEGKPAATLVDLLRARARAQPRALVFAGRGRKTTWAELDRRTGRVARVLRGLGLRAGERVGILAGNCPEWIEVFIGVHRAGGVVVPVNERLTPAERRWLLEDAGASLLVGEAELLAATPFSRPVLVLGPAMEEELAAAPGEEKEADIDADSLAVIAYTSGTTGTPKGAMWSHRGLLAGARANPFAEELAGGAAILVCAPLFAGGAIVMACNALAIGARVIVARFVPQEILRLLNEYEVEFTGMVPTMISLLVDAAPPGWRPAKLRQVYYGGGTMSPELFARASEVFGCEFQQCYGMTETCIVGTRLDPADHRRERPERLASAGKPMPGVQVKVAGPDGTEVPVGTPGEIFIRSAANMLGYWNREAENQQAFAGEWYRTRDIGRFDSDGYLYLMDRQDDMVKSGGLNVSPGEVEAVLMTHPGVEEVAVIGLADERWGERVAAIVRRRAGAGVEENALLALCRERLADFKRPRAIVFTATPLPRTGLGKISRQAVRKEYGGQGRA